MKLLLLSSCLTILFISCDKNNERTLQVQALTIDAQVVGNILSGPSVLNDPERFVWGGTVIKADDGKYYLYYVGSVDPGIQPIGSKGEKVNKRNRVQQYQKIGVIEINSFEDFSGKITEGKPGLAMLESLDGIKWTKPGNPFFMEKEVVLNTGDTIKVNRLERPQLLIGENGNPKVLYSACSLIDINPRKDGTSFNVHIPLTNG